MTFLDFLTSLQSADFDQEHISALLYRYLSHISENSGDASCKEEVHSFIASLGDEELTSLSSKLSACKETCNSELQGADIDATFVSKVQAVQRDIGIALTEYETIVANHSSTTESGEETAKETQKAKILEIKGDLDTLDRKVDSAVKRIDEKVFTLLINTVAVLGIFVAIAFTGFGTFSLFDQVKIADAVQSFPSFIKSVFFILLISFASYNLLLLLVYFIFKLSRPILDPKTIEQDGSDHGGNERFSDLVSLTRFLWIDVLLFALTLAAFFASCYFA